MDSTTALKSRFDVARILVLVESKLNIPPLVTVKDNSNVHKIIVSMKDHNELEDNVLQSNVNKDSKNGVGDAENRLGFGKIGAKLVRNKEIASCREIEQIENELDCFLNGGWSENINEKEFSSMLSEFEMVGGCEEIKNLSLCDGSQYDSCIRDSLKEYEEVNVNAVDNCLVDEEIGSESNDQNNDGLQLVVYEAGQCNVNDVNDIPGPSERRNAVILTEAERDWEISSALGLVFVKDKSQMIEVFTNLESEDRKAMVMSC
ncbi:hypothetical protein DITRI_Ditri01bG0087000 [Diplodiscus trichospermus]